MKQFTINPNPFLKISTQGFYSVNYYRHGHPLHPTCLTDLKNTFNNQNDENGRKKLKTALIEVRNHLRSAIPEIVQPINFPSPVLCVVPRAKAEDQYEVPQTLFRYAVELFAKESEQYIDGTRYILRHTNTKTTHLRSDFSGYVNDGASPYPGITLSTCDINPKVKGKHILLIDDIYTPGVNIDEDAIQALYNCGAAHVTFYAVAKTDSLHAE